MGEGKKDIPPPIPFHVQMTEKYRSCVERIRPISSVMDNRRRQTGGLADTVLIMTTGDTMATRCIRGKYF
jgi:hypothetical protein